MQRNIPLTKQQRCSRKNVQDWKKIENYLNVVQMKHATTVRSLDIGKYLPTS